MALELKEKNVPTVTERAATRFAVLLSELPQPRPRIRIFVDHRCHCGTVHFGLTVDDAHETDAAFEVRGVPFVADAAVLPDLDAAEIDYDEDFMRQGFTVRNARHSCGGHT